MTEVRRLWPDAASALTEADLLAAYSMTGPGPVVRMNFVTSVDGAVTVEGYSAGLGGPGDRLVFDLLRVGCDALMVGAGTLRHEGYGPIRLAERFRVLRREQGRAPDPTLVIVTGRLDLEPGDRMLAEAPVRPVVVTHGRSPADARKRLAEVADVWVCGETVVDLQTAVAGLAERGHRHVLSEGGPHLFGSLTAADLVDEMCLTIAPMLAGPGAGRISTGPTATVRNLTLAHALLCEAGELLLRYTRPGR